MITTLLAFLIRFVCGPTVRHPHISDSSQPSVYFANHSSHLDFLVIWATLPAEARQVTRPVAARDYWQAGRIRRLIAATLFRGVLIERGRRSDDDENPIEQMVRILDRKESLILFPEGTRGPGGEIAPFRAGLHYLQQSRPDVQLIPVYLQNLNRMLPKGEFLPVPLLSYITFGEPLPLIEEETRDEFLERARQAVIALEAP